MWRLRKDKQLIAYVLWSLFSPRDILTGGFEGIATSPPPLLIFLVVNIAEFQIPMKVSLYDFKDSKCLIRANHKCISYKISAVRMTATYYHFRPSGTVLWTFSNSPREMYYVCIPIQSCDWFTLKKPSKTGSFWCTLNWSFIPPVHEKYTSSKYALFIKCCFEKIVHKAH